MFDIGFWELVILFGLGLMVLGPERLPRVAAKVGRWAGQARRMANNLTRQIRDEVEPFESSIKSADENLRKDFSALRPEPPGGQRDDETVRTEVVDDDEPDATGQAK